MADIPMDITASDNIGNSLWKAIPLFPLPNEENKELSLQLGNKKKETGELQKKSDEQMKVNTLLKNHFNEIVQEIRSVQQILEARIRQMEAGQHVQKLIEREKSWLVKQKNILENETKEIRTRQELIKKDIQKELQKKEQVQKNLKMDYNSLERWLKEASKREEDVQILEKYKLCNSSKEKEMQHKIANADAERKAWKRRVRDTGLEIATMQQESYRLAEEFRSAHLQRKDVIEQLERAIDKLQKKDTEIKNLFQKLGTIREEQTGIEENNSDKNKLYERIVKDNQDIGCEIKSLDVQLEELHREVLQLQQRVNSANSELEIQRLFTNKLTLNISQTKTKKKELANEVKKRQKTLHEMHKKGKILKEELENWENERLEESNILQILETTLQKAEGECRKEQGKLDKIARARAKANAEMEEVKSEEKILLGQINKANSSIKHIKKKKTLIDKGLSEQQDSLYKLEYDILKKEQCVKRGNGKPTEEEELVELDCTYCNLEGIYEQKKDYLRFVKAHLRDDEKEVFQVKKKLEAFKMQEEEICEKFDEFKCCLLAGNSELKSITSKKEDLLVDKCMLKVKLDRLQLILQKNSDDMLNIQKKNLEFGNNGNLQLKELADRKNVLVTEARKLDQQCQVMTIRLSKAISRKENMQTRYRYLMSSLGLEEDQEGKEVELLIKTEEEKAKLQNEIGQAEEMIEKDREDIKTLKNTLSLINASNRMYQRRFLSNEGEKHRIKELETEKQILTNALKHKKEGLQESQSQLSFLKLNSEELENIVHNMENQLGEKDSTLSGLRLEIMEQEQKIHRAEIAGEKLLRSIKDSNILVDEKDINVHLLRELTKQVVSKIADVCAKNPEITNKIRKSFFDSSLPPLPRFPASSPLMSLRWTSSSSNSTTRQSVKSSRSNSPSVKRAFRTPSRERKLASPNIISLDIETIGICTPSTGKSIKLQS